MTSTIRFRVTAVATLAVFLVLALTGVGVMTVQRAVLTENLDESIAGQASELAALAAGDIPPELTVAGDDDTAAQIVDPSGSVVAATANVAGEPSLAGPPQGGQRIRTIDGLPHDDVDFRLLSRRVDGPAGPFVVHVAGPLDDIDESVDALKVSLLVAVPIVTIALGALVWWLVGRTLRPVEALRAEVTAIGASDLHRRVPVPRGDDEIARLAGTMNGMLTRIEDTVERQQRFVADASHELRGPLTRIRSELEVDLAHLDRADPVTTHRSVLDETIQLQHLVDDLLLLARSDAPAAPSMADEPVDVDDLVVRVARRLRADGRVTVDLSAVSAAQVRGDTAQLARAIGNLADNAVRHATSTVTFTLNERKGIAELAIADDGEGIAADQRQRIFERFARIDEARRDGGGTGLGLAIAHDVIVRHGGTIVVDEAYLDGARFVITLPAASDG